MSDLKAAVTGWAADEPLIRRVYLFGSRAKGTARPDSDVDLAILHGIDPKVATSCASNIAHWMTWDTHQDRWAADLQVRLARAHVHQIDRESRRRVVPALKECRVCLYRQRVITAGRE
jgi:hypothetical protein